MWPMRRWWRGAKQVREAADELDGAQVLVESHDEMAAASSVLGAAGFAGEGELLLRHLLFVDAGAVEPVLARFAPDGYVPAPPLPGDPPAPPGTVPVAFARLQPVTAVSVAQERSVVSSVTARLGGTVGGWAVLDGAESAAEPVRRPRRRG